MLATPRSAAAGKQAVSAETHRKHAHAQPGLPSKGSHEKGGAVTLPDRVTGDPEACAAKSGQEYRVRLFSPALHAQPLRHALPYAWHRMPHLS